MNTTDTNKALVRRYYDEVWCKGATDLVEQLFTADYENCDPATPGGVVRGPAGMRGLVASYRDAMPDLELRIYEQYADGDTVVSRWRASATQKGAMMGIPATGKRVEGIEGITVSEIRGGKVAKDHVVWDLAGLLRALGVLPS